MQKQIASIEYSTEEIVQEIKKLSEFNATSISDLAMHFQILISAKENKIFMEAPGLYYPDLDIYVISKSGLNRGHTSLHNSIVPVLPPGKTTCYAFVLYPGCFIRSCIDRVLRKTAKLIAKDLRISMENVFNRKHHRENLIGSEIESKLIALLQADL